ncbi:hypothetical protein [Streptomyces canus]|uniref:hypothetical protein n=1 Tax=Streptomyces canus TaxID=58343 RepID=UPI002DD7D0DD|nr:hypothetical protein [Streptomyces canus]WSD91704.1 hypothetical protein OG925_48740 [Streptomyces canus]
MPVGGSSNPAASDCAWSSCEAKGGVAVPRSVSFAVPLDRLLYTLPDGRSGFEAGEITVQGAFAADDIQCQATVPVPALEPPANAVADGGDS